jgi:hypothetical protein
MKKRICDVVEKFTDVKEALHRLEVDKKMRYGLAQVLLFYRHSGTGEWFISDRTLCCRCL